MARDVDTVRAVRRSSPMTSRLSSASLARQAAVVGVLAALGAIAFGGCGPGGETRYYCDDKGCFNCDAYGCSSVSPPSHPACTGNASCPPGSICTANGCSTQCADSSTCPKG